MTRASPRYAEFCEYRRIGGPDNTPSHIARKMGISTGMVYRWDKRFCIDFPDDYARVQSNLSLAMKTAVKSRRYETKEETYLRAQVRNLSDQLSKSHGNVACPIPDGTSTTVKGQIAEDLVCYQLRRRGFDVHRPSCVTGGTDLYIITPDNRIIRIEVKATGKKDLAVSAKRSVMKDNRWTRRNYEGCDVHFFALVDLKHENVFIVEASQLMSGRVVNLGRNSTAWAWKDAYHVLEQAMAGETATNAQADAVESGNASGESDESVEWAVSTAVVRLP